MRTCRFLLSAATATLVLGAALPVSAPAAVRYRVTELPTFGGDYGTAAAINEQGHVTGTAAFPRDRSGFDAHAYLYADGALTDLGAQVKRHDGVVGSFSDGRAINASDTVAGDELGRGGDAHPVLFGPARSPFSLPDWFNVIGHGLNDAGDVVGGSSFGGPGFLYHAGAISSLPGSSSVGWDVNNRGVVVGGVSLTAGAPYGAFVLRDGALTQLTESGEARAVSERGEIVGQSASPSGVWQAFSAAPGSSAVRPLGTLPGDAASGANAVSERGLVVGWSGSSPDDHRAVTWKSGRIVDLNSRIAAEGWILQEGTGVNAAGQIVGNGLHDGHPRGFLLTPVS